ncbi:MAG: hypothetical protein ABIR47_17515 [Candidatus Kapaibacterium sp.]
MKVPHALTACANVAPFVHLEVTIIGKQFGGIEQDAVIVYVHGHCGICADALDVVPMLAATIVNRATSIARTVLLVMRFLRIDLVDWYDNPVAGTVETRVISDLMFRDIEIISGRRRGCREILSEYSLCAGIVYPLHTPGPRCAILNSGALNIQMRN